MIIGFMQGDGGEVLYTTPCRESENDLGRSTAAMLCREADRLELYFVHSDITRITCRSQSKGC
jgi:hypothetical protein